MPRPAQLVRGGPATAPKTLRCDLGPLGVLPPAHQSRGPTHGCQGCPTPPPAAQDTHPMTPYTSAQVVREAGRFTWADVWGLAVTR